MYIYILDDYPKYYESVHQECEWFMIVIIFGILWDCDFFLSMFSIKTVE